MDKEDVVVKMSLSGLITGEEILTEFIRASKIQGFDPKLIVEIVSEATWELARGHGFMMDVIMNHIC